MKTKVARPKMYGVCSNNDCGRWGEAPAVFDEKTEFLKCTCGAPMFLSIFHPHEAGYRDTKKITVGTMPQTMSPSDDMREQP